MKELYHGDSACRRVVIRSEKVNYKNDASGSFSTRWSQQVISVLVLVSV